MSKTIIKPCPCCGMQPVLDKINDKWYYYCPNLSCPGNVTTDAYLNKGSATKAWNTRTETNTVNKSNKEKIYLYGARDTTTGKLVSDITNPRRKYWDKKGNATSAIDYYNSHYAGREFPKSYNKGKHGIIELVTFELVEVKEQS